MSFLKKLSKSSKENIYKSLLLIFLSVFVFFLVYFTGGTKTSWPQFNFIIILMAAYFFKVKVAVILALVLGLLMGPIMPMDVNLNLSQSTTNWIVRTMMFMIVGFFAGTMFERNMKFSEQIIKKDTTDAVTGLYNKHIMLNKIESLILSKSQFYIAYIKIFNLQEISMYVSQDIIQKIVDTFVATISDTFSGSNFFASGDDEFGLLVKDDSIDLNKIKEVFQVILNNLKQVSVDQYTFNLIVKVGIRVGDNKNISAESLFNSARITSYQGDRSKSSVSIFNLDFEKEMKFVQEISNSIAKAVTDNEFYIVYQPVICLKTKTICSVEVLSRWNRKDEKSVGPAIFIRIAEEIGLVPMITKTVINQHINNLKLWHKEDIDIIVHINITSEELTSIGLINWANKIVTDNKFENYRLGFEITEGTFHKNPKRINESLKHLRSLGFKIAIDDFGTGYNSIKNLVDFEADAIKIDKYFIDRISEEKIRNLLRSTIKTIHGIGLKAVAEGVETKEQLEVLIDLDCDFIQGYYFSKPLLPKDFIEYYKSFDINDYL